MSANEKQELPMAAIFVVQSERNIELCKGRPTDAFCLAWPHSAKSLRIQDVYLPVNVLLSSCYAIENIKN